MFHEQTQGNVGRRRRWIALAVAVVVLAAVLVWASGAASAAAREQAASSVRQAVLDAAMQCCAIEGAYPQSIDYLQEHYGLRVNEADYVVNYEVFASNVAPSVTVVPR